jgi:2-iminobutanoate/2-iminopropanoate deaminase
MRQKSIEVPGLAHASAPVPMASRVGPIFATSGIFGKNPDTGQMPPDAVGQAMQCFDNLKRLLAAAGLDMGDVVKITVFLANDQYRTAVNKPWNEHFPDPSKRPARHALVLPLRGGALVQIEAIAVAKGA